MYNGLVYLFLDWENHELLRNAPASMQGKYI